MNDIVLAVAQVFGLFSMVGTLVMFVWWAVNEG
jgi:hypothetical protein